MKQNNYTADDIKVLSDNQHVRLRTPVYFGSLHPTTFNIPLLSSEKLNIESITLVPAVYKAVGEIIDNSLDEFSQINIPIKLLTIIAQPELGKYTIRDNGRGVPIDKHSTGKYTPEVVFGSLRSGRNFTDDKEIGVLGMNGVGSSCTNFCSTKFSVSITRDSNKYVQHFTDGATKIQKPKIAPSSTKTTGTEVSFELDPAVFKDVSLPDSLIRNRAIEIALTNPDITVEYNNEKFRFKKGFQEYINNIASDKINYKFNINEENIQGEIYVVCDGHSGTDELMYTWMNSSLLFDGGKCNTQFFNVLFDTISASLEKKAKKLKTEVTRNDIRSGLLVFANLKIRNPEYDSQSKTRQVGPDLRKEFISIINSNWKAFSKIAAPWLSDILERANDRHHKDINKKAINEHEKKKKLKIPGLLDAVSRNRQECQILLTEGNSAKAKISEARDPDTTAAFALTGKINNVWGFSPAEVLKMSKLTELLAAIGLTPGKKAIRSELNYGRIVIATDADQDGADIFTLLTNIFYQFWPELFDPSLPPIIYRLVAPNVVASKGGKRVHFTTRAAYEYSKEKYKGWSIVYMKGLGSMEREDWEVILSGKVDTLIPIVDDGNLKNVFDLLFGPDAELRRAWLSLT